MAIPKRTTTEGTFFITAITHNRRRIFQVSRNAELSSKRCNTIAPQVHIGFMPSLLCQTMFISC